MTQQDISQHRFTNGRLNLRRFHQAKWDEPIIFELSQPGERGVLMPTADPGIENEIGDGLSTLPPTMLRKDPPALPELGQMQVLKHFLRLSQENLGADLNVDIGHGTCTMKYSPKINEQFANLELGFVDAAVVASAETLEFRRIVMTDRRDFGALAATRSRARSC